MKCNAMMLIAVSMTALTGCRTMSDFKPDAGRAAATYVRWNGRTDVPRERIEWVNLIAHDPLAKDDLPTVLAIGDSIVGNYAKPLAAELKGRAHLVQLNGSRCVGDPCLLDEFRMALKVRKYDVITVNNGLHGAGCADEDYARYLREYLCFIRANAPEAKLVWVGVSNHINDRPRPGVESWAVRSERRNASSVALAREFGIPVADVHPLITAHPEYHQKDGIHMNPEGSAALAKAVAAEVVKLLPAKTTPENAAFNAAHASRFNANTDGTWLLGYETKEQRRRILTIGYEAGQAFGRFRDKAGAASSALNTWTDIGDPVRSAVEAYLLDQDRYAAVVIASVWKDFRPRDGEERLSDADYAARLSDYIDFVKAPQSQAIYGWVISKMSAGEGSRLETLKRVCAEKGVRVLASDAEMEAFAQEAMTRPLPAANGPNDADRPEDFGN